MLSKRLSRFFLVLLSLAVVGCDKSPYAPNIKVSREPARGVSATDLDDAYLERLSEWTRAAAQQRLTETYDSNKVSPERRTSRARVNSRYIQIDGKKLAFVDLGYTGNAVRVARITGFKRGEMVTVSCTSPDGAPIQIIEPQSACAEAVRDVFFD